MTRADVWLTAFSAALVALLQRGPRDEAVLAAAVCADAAVAEYCKRWPCLGEAAQP